MSTVPFIDRVLHRHVVLSLVLGSKVRTIASATGSVAHRASLTVGLILAENSVVKRGVIPAEGKVVLEVESAGIGLTRANRVIDAAGSNSGSVLQARVTFSSVLHRQRVAYSSWLSATSTMTEEEVRCPYDGLLSLWHRWL